MHPPPGIKHSIGTHILNRTIRQFPIPLILHLRDLPRRIIIKDINFAVNSLLLIDALYDITGPQIHGDGVSAGSDFVMETLDLGEGGLQTVPLGFVLLATDGFGDGVFESAIVGPELEFLEGGTACEELGGDLVVENKKVGLEMDFSLRRVRCLQGFFVGRRA